MTEQLVLQVLAPAAALGAVVIIAFGLRLRHLKNKRARQLHAGVLAKEITAQRLAKAQVQEPEQKSRKGLPITYRTMPVVIEQGLRALEKTLKGKTEKYVMLHQRYTKRMQSKVRSIEMNGSLERRPLTGDEQRSVYKMLTGDNLPKVTGKFKPHTIEQLLAIYLDMMSQRQKPKAIARYLTTN